MTEELAKDEKIYFSLVEDIFIPEDRMRKEFDPEDLRKLAESIKRRRQDTPGLCIINEDGKVQLVAGERRLRACSLADVPFCYRIVTCTDSLEALEMEYEENVLRVNLNWLEEETAFVKLQNLKQQKYGASRQGAPGGWGIKDTAEIAGVSVGKVHEALELAAYAESFPEVKEAKTKKEAKKIVDSIKSMNKRVALLQQVVLEDEQNQQGSGKISKEERTTYLNNMERIKYGDMMELLQEDENIYNLVLFDPPWGVDLDTVRDNVAGQLQYKDSEEEAHKLLPRWLKAIYDKMADDSHIYMFFGIVNYAYVYQCLEQVGFETNGIPLIWHKIGAHTTRNPSIWPGLSYEPIAYGRKGKRPLVALGRGNVISVKTLPYGKKGIHPSAKHPAVYLDLLQRSALPGDKVLDPMCGSAMSGVACDVLDTTHKLKYTGYEIDDNYRMLGLENLAKGYYQITEEENIRPREESDEKTRE